MTRFTDYTMPIGYAPRDRRHDKTMEKIKALALECNIEVMTVSEIVRIEARTRQGQSEDARVYHTSNEKNDASCRVLGARAVEKHDSVYHPGIIRGQKQPR